ncbi:MAG: hypothetical protein QW717_01365 [Candidatus Bathyarchaeia archaeon]
MAKIEKEVLEVVLGVFLMVLSFFLTLLTVIRTIESSFILMFLLYSMSLSGLVIGLHGLYSFILTRRVSNGKEN